MNGDIISNDGIIIYTYIRMNDTIIANNYIISNKTIWLYNGILSNGCRSELNNFPIWMDVISSG
jgi:hypothetical protein